VNKMIQIGWRFMVAQTLSHLECAPCADMPPLRS
jgi:hypothetical protein